MKMIKILPLFVIVPTLAFGAARDDTNVHRSIGRVSVTASRMPSVAGHIMPATSKNVQSVADESSGQNSENTTDVKSVEVVNDETSEIATTVKTEAVTAATTSTDSSKVAKAASSGDCRDVYRDCMDAFCLLDESQGLRCACSDNIDRAKSKINEVLKIQAEADKLYSEGVEREQLGAKAKLVFAENTKNTNISSANFMSWLSEDAEQDEDVGEDVVLGDALYKMAVKNCKAELAACGDKSDMESLLYSRLIIKDCKNYDLYLADQKRNAESNKQIAESAVRKARLEMLGITNKYNRGECLLAYRSCIIDKGGCGAKFENCLDANLLKRRSNACDNILDQCMAVRKDVEKDWAAESKSVLEEAAKYADTNKRGTCLARAQNCLEESCATSTNAECLTDVNVAAGICPVITECNEIIPGFQDVVNDKLGYLKIKFCENDIDKCLQDKCGVDFRAPECVGKKPYEIADLCPQDMFPSCKNEMYYNVIVQSAILQMDYQMYTGCVNYFAEQLGRVCGTDMACLPIVSSVESLTDLPALESELLKLREKVIADSDAAVEEFFQQFEQDKTVAACADSQSVDASKKMKNKKSLGDSVFMTAKLLAKMSAENRNLRELDSKIAELSRQKDVEEAKKVCLTTYQAETPDKSKSNYTYIKSVSFEPSLRNCHVCRMQQVCEEGGESKMSTALKTAATGGSAGLSAGSLGGPWVAAIGAIGGAVATGVGGYLTADGKNKFCQEIESCEDINM